MPRKIGVAGAAATSRFPSAARRTVASEWASPGRNAVAPRHYVYKWYTIGEKGLPVPYIEAIEIDDQILDKIESRHGVLWHEAEEACYSEQLHVRRGREGLYKVFSRTEAGRYLLVVLVELGGGVWKVVTARGMTEPEQRLYRRAIGG